MSEISKAAASATGADSLLPAGATAPDFTLAASTDGGISLSGLRGRNVVLAFYPADWSPVCSDQMALYSELLPEFRRLGAELLGISVDNVWSHKAFAAARKISFPLLADFEPKGAVSKAYGAYRAEAGTSARVLYVIDKDGIVRWSYRSPNGVNPGADGILAALEDLAAGKG